MNKCRRKTKTVQAFFASDSIFSNEFTSDSNPGAVSDTESPHRAWSWPLPTGRCPGPASPIAVPREVPNVWAWGCPCCPPAALLPGGAVGRSWLPGPALPPPEDTPQCSYPQQSPAPAAPWQRWFFNFCFIFLLLYFPSSVTSGWTVWSRGIYSCPHLRSMLALGESK